MTKEDYIRLGFAPLPHYTVVDVLLFQLGRDRNLSALCVGTSNEMIWICQMNDEDPKKYDDLVCLHNFDYDGLMTEDRLKALIEALTVGGVDKSTDSGLGLQHVSFAKRKVCRCYEMPPKKHADSCDTCGRAYM